MDREFSALLQTTPAGSCPLPYHSDSARCWQKEVLAYSSARLLLVSTEYFFKTHKFLKLKRQSVWKPKTCH